MGKKPIILVTACVIIIVVIFFGFFVFKTPTQTTKDPYSAAYCNEFDKTPTLAYTYSFSPPVSMYHALLIALESGGWNATSLRDTTIRVELDYFAFYEDSSNTITGGELLSSVAHSVVDWSPQQINDRTTYRYVWAITVGAQEYFVDVATAELVITVSVIPVFGGK